MPRKGITLRSCSHHSQKFVVSHRLPFSHHSHAFAASHRSRGFALLFAVLATSVLLSISAAIWNIALREIILSSFGRESQVAFYVADSATECALYWDFTGVSTFATSTDTLNHPPPGRPEFITCEKDTPKQVTPFLFGSGALYANSNFSVPVGDGNAVVYVFKNNPSGGSQSLTTIETHGQSSRVAGDPTNVERGLRVQY